MKRLLILLIILMGCSPATMDSSQDLARSHILSLEQFEGESLRLIHSENLECAGCYAFTYEFDTLDEDAVTTYKVKVPVLQGEVEESLITEHSTAISEQAKGYITQGLCYS